MASSAVPPPAPPPPATSAKLSLPSKIYNGLIGAADKYVPDKLRPLWNHPAGKFLHAFFYLTKFRFYFTLIYITGPKTVFFWSPMFKWVSVYIINSVIYRRMHVCACKICRMYYLFVVAFYTVKFLVLHQRC